jgi:serine/threonine protein kinase
MQVFRVFDAELKDSLAVRRVKKSMGDPEDIAKEKQINEQLRKVDNENILKIYDIIEQPDTVWYITEYCSGGSLWYC